MQSELSEYEYIGSYSEKLGINIKLGKWFIFKFSYVVLQYL